MNPMTQEKRYLVFVADKKLVLIANEDLVFVINENEVLLGPKLSY